MKKSAFPPAVAAFAALAMASVFVASPAFAHPGHTTGYPLLDGVVHPFTGLDHMLAMTAVGLLAALRGDRALWAWPAAFVTAMLAGYAVGLGSPPVHLVEPMIAASIIVLGALTAANPKLPLLPAAALIGVFGFTHGFAHGQEAPDAGMGAAWLFPLGFAAATATLHAIGLGAGLSLRKVRAEKLIRVLGLATAIGGVMIGCAQ